MIEYLITNNWRYAGNCNSCNGGMWYVHPKWTELPEGKYRLKIIGNTRGQVEQNQNPMNKSDFKIIDVFDSNNYQTVLNKYFA